MAKNCLIVIGILAFYTILAGIFDRNVETFMNLLGGTLLVGIVNLIFCGIFKLMEEIDYLVQMEI